MPPSCPIPEGLLARILKAIQDEDENISFLQSCNENKRSFGATGSLKRRACQIKRRNLLDVAKRKPGAYLALLKKHNLLARMPVKLNRHQGKAHSDQNENDIDFDCDESVGKFVEHFVFSFISFDKCLTFCFVLQGLTTRKKTIRPWQGPQGPHQGIRRPAALRLLTSRRGPPVNGRRRGRWMFMVMMKLKMKRKQTCRVGSGFFTRTAKKRGPTGSFLFVANVVKAI
jgi:hypothetical protein